MDRCYARQALSLVCFFALTFVACGPTWRRPPALVDDPSLTWVACLHVPFESRAAAHSAVEKWSLALGKWRRLRAVDVVSDDDRCDLWIHVGEPPPDDDGVTLGWTSMQGGREITLVEGRHEHDVEGILLHELGHALGAQHLPGTLMDATWRPHAFICPDPATVAQVAAWHRVSLDLLSWCY